MSADDLTSVVQENLEPSAGKRLRAAVNDAFAFIRSAEVNAAIGTVTLEQLMGDQILRNGESARSNAAKYDPYSYSPEDDEAAGNEPLKRATLPSAVDTERPTRYDRVLAIVNVLSDVVQEIKELEPVAVYEAEEYADVADVAAPVED